MNLDHPSEPHHSKFINPIVGLDNAARDAWFQNTTHAASNRTKHDTPTNATACRAQLYDADNAAYSDLIFNNAGTVLAVGTFAGLIRLIGLQTLRCVCSINTLNPENVHVESGTTDKGGRSEMSVLSDVGTSEVERQETTQNSPQISSERCLAPVRVDNLEFLDFDQKLSCISSNHLLVYNLMSKSVSEIVRIDLQLVFDSLQNILYSERPPFTSIESELVPPIQFDSQDGTRKVQPQLKSTHSTPQPVSTFCKVLQLIFSSATPARLMQIDFVISYATTPALVPLRIHWDVVNQRALCVTPVLDQMTYSTKEMPAVIFTRRYRDWTFLVDNSTKTEETLEVIRSHNGQIQFRNDVGTSNFSIWGINELTRVFCAIGHARGVMVVELLPEVGSQSCIICGRIDTISGPVAGLSVNRSGTLILSRSIDRVILISISESEDNTTAEVQLHLCLRFSYADAVQRKRFECSTFCDAPSSDNEMFLLCSGGASPSVHFFQTTASSDIQSLNMTKTGGLKQIVWRPGSSMWGGLSAKESCILLFSPAPPNNIWALMTPDFEYLEKNREIVESEVEFDDLLWLERQDTITDGHNEMIRNDLWFTSVVRDTTPHPYPFCCPQIPTSDPMEMTKEKSKFDVYSSLLKARLERLKVKIGSVEDIGGSGDEKFQKSNDVIWFTDSQSVRNRYKDLLRSI